MTLAELMAMAEANGRMMWSHTSSLMAIVVNMHKPKGRRARASDFNPYASCRGGGGLRVAAANIHVLEALLPAHKRTRRSPASERTTP